VSRGRPRATGLGPTALGGHWPRRPVATHGGLGRDGGDSVPGGFRIFLRATPGDTECGTATVTSGVCQGRGAALKMRAPYIV
jgi:hypothetical protein